MLFLLIALGGGFHFTQGAWRQGHVVAAARIVVGWRKFHDPNEPLVREHGTVEQILESAAIASRARVRIHALHPNLTEVPVRVRADVVDRVFHHYTVRATGSSQDYTVKYLNSLIDEFRGFVMDLRHQLDAPLYAEIETLGKQLNLLNQSTDANVALKKERLQERLDRLQNELYLKGESDPVPTLDRAKLLPPEPPNSTGLIIASVAGGLLVAVLVYRKLQAAF